MRRRAPRQRGSATVEFALVLPFVLLVALALLQTGLLMKDRLLVAGAARAGAREAAVGGDGEAVRSAAIQAGGLDPVRLEVEVEGGDGAGAAVSVKVRYRSPVAVPLIDWLFPAEVVVVERVTMRLEVDADP